MANKNPTYVIDIKTRFSDIKKQIKEQQEALIKLQKTSEDLGLGKNISEEIQKAIDELQKMQSEYINTMKEFSKTKLDTSEFTEFSKKVDARLNEVTERVLALEKNITGLSKSFKDVAGIDELNKQFDGLEKRFDNFVNSVKDSINALKEFNTLIGSSSSGNQDDIKKQIKEYEELAHVLETIDFGSKRTTKKSKDFDKLQNEFDDLYDKYTDLMSIIEDEKDPSSIIKMQKEVAELLPKLANVYNAMIKIKDENDLDSSFKPVIRSLTEASSNIQTILESNAAKLKANLKSETEEMQTVAGEMFKFKDGKIQIPVILDEKAISSLKPKYKEIISQLQAYANTNPVDVTMRLFPLNTTKAGQAEVKDAVKNVQAQIADLPEGDLKTSMTDLYNNLEKQYQKALRLKIAVELSEDADAVRKDIEAIKKAVNDDPIEIYPKFIISEKEATALKEKLKTIQDSFSFNVTDSITKMSDSLKVLLESNNTKEWVKNFISGLQEIESELEKVSSSIQPINDLLGTKGKSSKNKSIDQNDVNIITAFTDAMTSLRTALDKQGDIKIDIDIQPLIDKLDVIKATVGIVISELGYLQSTLNKIKDDKTAKDSSDFMKNIQESVNKSQPIIIPIEPDLSKINSFIEKIEEAVSGIKVKLNIGNPEEETHTESKLNDILQDKNNANKLYHQMYNGLDANAENIGEPLKKAIAFALVNGLRDGLSSTEEMLRVGLKGTQFESIVDQIVGDEESLNNIKTIANNVAESFTSAFNKGNNLESSINEAIKNVQSVLDVNAKNQFDNLNVRVDELQTKINSLWSVWVNNVNNGTNETIEGINRIIARLGDLAVKLEEVSKKFPGVNFGDTISDVKNLVYNNGRSDSDIGEIISQMMEADKIMLAAKRQIRERAFYYNLKDGNHSNTYTFDKPTSYGLKNQLLKNDDISKYDTHVHTHPEKYASMSLVVKERDRISGDILAFFMDYLKGIETQVIAAQDNVEIFDAKNFYDKYKNIFANSRGTINRQFAESLNKATDDVLKEYRGNILKTIEAFKISNLNYEDLYTDDKGNNIFSLADIYAAPDERRSFNIAARSLYKQRDNIIKDYFDLVQNDPSLKFSSYLKDTIYNNLSGFDKTQVSNNLNIQDDIDTYTHTVARRIGENISHKLFQELYGLATPEILKRVGIDDFDNYVTRMPIEEFRDKYSGIAQVTQEQQTGDTAKESAQNIDKETQAMAELYDKAIAAAEAKSKFVEANKDVFNSIVTSLSALNSEGEGFANLNKLINNLGGKSGDEKLDKTVNGLKQIYEVLNQDIGDNALINALNDLASKGTDLENLATVLKSSKKQITDAKDALNVSNQDKIDSIAKSVDVSGNARGFLSSYGDVVNLTQEVKKGFIEITSTVLGADNVFRRYTLTTKDGLNMNIAKQEEHTTGLEKEILLYQKLLKAAQNLNRVNPNQTDEVFIEEGSDTWNSVVEYAKEYGDNLGNILSITRSVRKVNDELLESFKIIGENGSVTIGAENDVVGSVQNIANITKQYKELLNLRNKLNDTDLKNTQREIYTPEYISRIREMISLIDSAEFDLTNPADVARLEQMVSEAKELDFASKNLDNNLGNMKNLEKLRMKIADILNDFGAMPNKLKEEFGDLKGTVEFFIKAGRISAQQSDELNAKFMELNANLSESGKKYQSLGKQMLERLRSQSSQLLAQYFSFQDLIRYGRTAVTTIIQLDTALVDLRKTTSMNTQELNEFYRASTDIGKQLGVTSQQIIQQAAAWSRLGYNTKEQSEQMAALSSKFASISPGMGTDEAQTGLVSVMKAWKIDVVDVEREIMDNINVLGNNFAETNADIITGMEKAGATLAAIGTDYKDAFALFTGAQEVIQNAETVGTAMKTLSLRIRGYDEETEELSDDVINAMGKVADLTKVASNNFAGVSLWADAEQTKYRSLKEYLGDIAKIWSEISAGNQTELLEKLFGKRGASVGSAILGNFEQVEKAIEQMEGAAGSADREMGIIRDSMEFKLNAIKQEWVETLTTVTDSGDLKSLLDFILKVSEGLGDIVTNIGLIKTLVIGVSTVVGSKKLGIFNTQDSGTLIGALIQKHQKNKEISDYKAVLNGYQNRKGALLNADFSQAQDMTDSVKKSIGDIQQKVRDAKGTGDEVFTHIQYQMEATAGKTTKLGNSIKTFFKGALNGLVSMVASAAISFAIDAVIKKLDKEIITAKEAAAMTAQFNDSFAAMQKEQIETSKVIGELDEEFQRLSKGVNSLGHNVSLTEDEFKRYNEITSIIAEKAPNLVKGYTEQGDAIINLTGGVNTLTEAYKEMQEQQARTEYNKLDSDGSRITKGVFENTQNVIDDYEKRYRDLNETRETILKLIQLDEEEFNELMDQIAKGDENGNYNTELEDLVVQAGYTGDASDNYEEIHKNLIQVYKDTESEFREYEANLKSATKDIAQAGQLYVHGITTYWKDLDDSQRSLLDTFMSQIDNLEDIGIIADKLGYNITDEQGMKDFVTQLVGMISKLSSDDLNQIETRFNVETLFNNNELSYNEYLTQLQDLETWLSELPEEQQSIIRILFNISDTDEAGNDITNAIIDARKNAGTYNKTSYEKSDRDKEVDQWLGTLNNEDLNIVANLTLNGDELVPELQQLLAEAKRMAEANTIEVKVKASDAVDSMADAKTAITSINELWEQTVQNNLALKKDKKYLDEDGNVLKQYDSQNMAAGFADPEKINAAESAFKSFIQTASDSGKDVTQMNIALEEFEKTLVEQPGDAEAAQKAIDNLITAYIDQTDIIKNLTEENAEWSIAQLEAYGVTNAEQVVMSRLNTTVKKLAKQFEIAADSIKTLNTEMKGSANWNTSMENVQSSLNEMFKTDLGDGEFITPNFDEAWIVQNLDLITEAASGSYDAIYKVQKAAAQRIAMQVDINMPNQSAINGTLNYINQLINDFPIDDIEVGTNLDTDPMIQGLNGLVDAGTITRDSMNAILASIGVEPDITYESVPVEMYANKEAAAQASGLQSTALQQYRNQLEQGRIGTVRVPKIGYKMGNKGVGAQYASPPGGGSSSGGGGGGGGGGSSSEPTKPKEEAEETFDWIEVAIQRIEEEIARLDKVVGNSYDFWVKRNEALLKEINKTKDEIKAQQIAYSEYLRNANAVQVNNGKGLNADDYGENDSLVKAQDERLLAEAKKAWGTGEYQKKVQEGLMTGKDIETIQNHFLSETIKKYQELINKAISAQDAVQDLKIKLGDLARTNFDHVKGEAEDAISYFESYADLINARIERTEEKGYFATKTFQGALISYEQERLKVLKKEYDDLIAKRDEATRTKAILPYSEEFNKMNQEILEVGKSIEEATTNLVKFNNEMRQHDWDVFDFTQERINNIAEEFDFLIDLLDNQKLYDDYGLFNSRGWADSALHAGKYNAYMEQALQYAKEREKIEADLKKDNADKNLIERREELIKLQQESITNAYAEKEAVKSLVEEGISIHLQKLSELIDEYKESLKSAKD